MKVLIAEDHADDRRLLRRSLEHYDCEVIEAADGREGLDLALEHKPDVIISDALMPHMDGFQFLSEVKRSSEIKAIPFVFYTGTYVGDKEARLAMTLGAAAYLVKPKEPEEFWRELKAILEGLKTGKKGTHSAELIVEDEEYLKKYSEIVAMKLEEKVKDLEKEIAEHKKVEEALRESQIRHRLLAETLAIKNNELRLFRVLMDNANDSIYVVDPETGRLLDVNERAVTNTGYSREELLAMHVMDLDMVTSEKSLWKDHAAKIQEKGRIIFETSHKRKDGTTYPVEINTRHLFLDGANYFIGIARDITERNRLDEHIRILVELVDIAPALITVHDLDGNYLYANQTACDLHGYSKEEFLALNIHQHDIPEDERLIAPRIKQIMETGNASFEVRHYRKDRSIMPLQLFAKLAEWGGKKMILSVSSDITERKIAEALLGRSEAMLSEAQRVAHIGNWEWKPQTDELHWSEENYRIWGLSREIAPSVELFMNSVHPDDKGHVKRSIDDALHGQPYDLDMRIIRTDGTERIVNARAKVEFDKDGKPLRMFGTAQDITERKQAEEALKESATKYRIVANNTAAWEFWLDQEGRFMYSSSAGEGITGRTAEEFMAAPTLLRAIVHPDDRVDFDDHRHAVEEEKKNNTLQFRIVRPDGDVRWIDHVCQPVYDEEGRSLGTRGSNRDITDRKQAEEVLRESQERYRIIVDNSMDAILLTVPDGGILSANLAACRMFGCTEEELCRLGRASVVDMTDPRLPGLLEERVLTGKARGELTFLRKDGSIFPGEISSTIFKDRDGRDRTSMIIRDITERKQAEDAVKTALAEKEVLLKEVHHRVKNNMQIISSLLNLQAKKIPSPDLKMVFEETRGRIKSMSFIHEMLYNTKDFSKIKCGDYINKLVKDLVSAAKVKANEITITVKTDDISLGVDTAIPLGLITNELVTNALKYAFPRGGGGELLVSLSQADDLFTLSVKDNGAGLPEGFHYEKADTLGLQLVSVMVKQIGGTFRIGSERGTEAVVTFSQHGDGNG